MPEPKKQQPPPAQGPVDATAYLALRSEKREGDIHLWEIHRVTVVAGQPQMSRVTEIRPLPRELARDRLVVLSQGRDVLP